MSTLPVWAGYVEGVNAAHRSDYETARREYLTAALDGNPKAQNNLGQLYLKGLGGPVDLKQAFRWFSIAAAAGQVNAQTTLADMYETGKAGTVDYSRALYWYHRAAVSGFFIAQLSFASMLEAGRGINVDHVAALAWYILATRERPSGSNEHYLEEFNLASQARDALSARLDSAAVETAKNLAGQWFPGHSIEEIRYPRITGGEGTSADRETIVLRREGGTYVLPTVINGRITLDFTLDSGAADVSIPADVAMTLMRTKTLTSGDFLGQQTYQLADGSNLPSQQVRIRSLRIGDIEMKDIVASIVPPNGSLLLGQSFLGRLPSWTIDNRQPALIVEETTTAAKSLQQAEQYSEDVIPTVRPAKISDYQLQQWAMSANPKAKGTLRVRASILNTTNDSLPYPLLRVTLSDQSGRRIAEREFDPSEYLGTPRPSLLAARKQAEADFGIPDPGNDAAKFAIEICIWGDNTQLICASDSKVGSAAPR
jgi:clan AA aspartic protease (TIGR02281 family)